MKNYEQLAALFAKKYTYCTELLNAFIPILEAKQSIAQVVYPKTIVSQENDEATILYPLEQCANLYLDDLFLEQAPKIMLEATQKALPHLAEDCKKIEEFILEKPSDFKKILETSLQNKKLDYQIKKYSLPKVCTIFLVTNLISAAAMRFKKQIQIPNKQKEQNRCPLCGSKAHASYLKNKEGERYLVCGVCANEWRFSRTTCPNCAQNNPEKIQVYFIENSAELRAEVCEACQTYILCPDLRAISEEIDFDLLLLCASPLEELLQEQGFSNI